LVTAPFAGAPVSPPAWPGGQGGTGGLSGRTSGTGAEVATNGPTARTTPTPEATPQDNLATALSLVAAAAEKGPEVLGNLIKTLESALGGEHADPASALPEKRIAIDADAHVVPNQKGHDAMKIYGPYRHGDRWRLTIRQGKKQHVLSFPNPKEAQTELAHLRKAAARQAGVLTEKAIADYAEQLRGEGLRVSSITTAVFRLKGLLKPVLTEPLATISAQRARELYQNLPGAVDTRLNVLALAKKFGRVAVENGWTDVPLCGDIKPKGRRRCGKTKLGLDESRRYLATCLRRATSTNVQVRTAATAAAMPLLFGMRSSEVLGLAVRDLDDGGRVLRITAAKTRAGIRTLVVPEWFRPLLLSAAENLKPEDRIFPHEKTWIHHHVVAICKEAGVTRVVPHGLRGTHADLSLLAAATPLQVSQALGHTNTGVTFRHYADKDLAAQQQHQQAVQALVPTQPPN